MELVQLPRLDRRKAMNWEDLLIPAYGVASFGLGWLYRRAFWR